MNNHWIKRILALSLILVVVGFVFFFKAGKLISYGIFFLYTGFILNIVLWINEAILQWHDPKNQNKSWIDKLASLFWLIVSNFYGAYFFSYKRINKT